MKVEKINGHFVHKNTKEALQQVPAKMSKSLKNIVNPDDIIQMYGADSLRLYEMFIGPLESTKPWNTKDIEGVFRFLQKVIKVSCDENGQLRKSHLDSEETLRLLNQTIKKVEEDIENMSFNTAISQMMILVNHLLKEKLYSHNIVKNLIKILSPFAPHIAEEIWEKFAYKKSITYEKFPSYDKSKLVKNTLDILVQILGKPVTRISIQPNLTKEQIERIVLKETKVKERLNNTKIKKLIIVPNRLVNIVV